MLASGQLAFMLDRTIQHRLHKHAHYKDVKIAEQDMALGELSRPKSSLEYQKTGIGGRSKP
jgi:hypothetical protein